MIDFFKICGTHFLEPQTDRQKGRQKYKHTDGGRMEEQETKQRDRHTDIQADIKTGRQAGRQADRQTDIQTDGQRMEK